MLILEVKVAGLNHATSSTEKLELTRGLGKVVSVLAFSSGDPSLNPVEVYAYFCKNELKELKRGREWPIFSKKLVQKRFVEIQFRPGNYLKNLRYTMISFIIFNVLHNWLAEIVARLT